MMKLDCGIRAEELILYTDGVLRGGRGELVEAHLRVCLICRQWMADFAHTGRLIREATPVRDDPASRAAILARIEQAARRGRRPGRPRLLSFVVAALALALLGVLLLPAQNSEARGSIGRFFAFLERGVQRPILPGGATPSVLPTVIVRPVSPGGLAALPFTPQQPAALPLGLQLAQGQIVRGERLELRYRNEQGLVLAVMQERVQDVHHINTTGGGQFIVIGGVEVLWQSDPWPDSVAVLTWEDGGILYSISPDANPTGAFPLVDARQIVEALLAGR